MKLKNLIWRFVIAKAILIIFFFFKLCKNLLFLPLEQTYFILSRFGLLVFFPPFQDWAYMLFDFISDLVELTQLAFIKPNSHSTLPYRLVKSVQHQTLEKSPRLPRKRRRKTLTSLRSPSRHMHCFFETPRRPLRVRTPTLRLGKSPRSWRPCGTVWERSRNRYMSAVNMIMLYIQMSALTLIVVYIIV